METELLCRVFMTSSEWIGLEIICYYCIYSTPRWAGSISPGGSVWISSAIVQYSIQLSKFCLRSVTLLCYSICICCVTSLYFVSSAPYLPSDSWNGEIAVLKFQASVPLQLFHTGGYILFNCRRWKYLWPGSFSISILTEILWYSCATWIYKLWHGRQKKEQAF